MPPPVHPKIYHVAHVDRLPSIVAEGCLWCDAETTRRPRPGTTIGIAEIKRRRMTAPLTSHPGLHVGDCVPFYFCPRSVMLYVIHMGNRFGLAYRGGQELVVHLEADLRQAVDWADRNGWKWAFTLTNAGSAYFDDRCDLTHLDEIDWSAVRARYWRQCKDEKQAEFLVEISFPWNLVQRVGVHSESVGQQVHQAMRAAGHRPGVEVMRNWYY